MARAKSWHTGAFTYRPKYIIPAVLSERLHRAFPKRQDVDAFLKEHCTFNESAAGTALGKLLELVELEDAKKKTADMSPETLRALLNELEAKGKTVATP